MPTGVYNIEKAINERANDAPDPPKASDGNAEVVNKENK